MLGWLLAWGFGPSTLGPSGSPLELRPTRPLIDERCKGDAAATDDDVDVEICDTEEDFLLKKIISYSAHVLC